MTNLWYVTAASSFLLQSQLVESFSTHHHPLLRVASFLKSIPEEDYGPDEFQEGLDNVLSSLGGGGISPPSKADVYSNEELMSIFNVHQELMEWKEQEAEETEETNSDVDEQQDSIFALHETVLQAMNQQASLGIDALSSNAMSSGDPILQAEQEEEEERDDDWLNDPFKSRIANIRCIASDVDGTLLTSDQSVHPRTKLAVLEALKRVENGELLQFFPATGKSRKGALDSLGREVGTALSNCPGVFLQGLYCVGKSGEIVFEQKLDKDAVAAAESLAAEQSLSVVAYDGDGLFTINLTPSVVELHERYGEPLAEQVDSIAALPNGVHKLLLMDPSPEKLRDQIRGRLQDLAEEYNCCVTQAIPTMLELLPPNCSKARGVKELCKMLNIDVATQVLALGDAENDAEMLREASIGVAMGNASPVAQEAADFVMTETNNEGGAGAAIQVFGFGMY